MLTPDATSRPIATLPLWLTETGALDWGRYRAHQLATTGAFDLSGHDWIDLDVRRQIHMFEQGTPVLQVTVPARSLFVRAAEYDVAREGQLKYCSKPHHMGDRLLEKRNLGKTLECLMCKIFSTTLSDVVDQLPRLVVPCTAEEYRVWESECNRTILQHRGTLGKVRMPTLTRASFATPEDAARIECEGDGGLCSSPWHDPAVSPVMLRSAMSGNLCYRCRIKDTVQKASKKREGGPPPPLYDTVEGIHVPRYACGKCRLHKPLAEFRPYDCEMNARSVAAFDAAVAALDGTPEREAVVNATRRTECIQCRTVAAKSMRASTTKVGMCREYWRSIAQEPCIDCGSTENIEYDHIDPDTKTQDLGSYTWWSNHGGVPAMKLEKTKCVPRCRPCHDVQPTHTKHQRKYATPEEMPTDTYRERERKRFRIYRDLKYAHVLQKKAAIGACEACARSFDASASHLFHFAHIDASTKRYHVSDLCRDRYCPETRLPVIDAEIAKCRLLCVGCHKAETRARAERRFAALSAQSVTSV